MSTKPITISPTQARDILAAIRGATPVTITALTKPEQKVSPFGTVRKLVRVNAMTGCIYENALRKAVGDDAEAGDRAWGERNQSCLTTKTAKDGTTSYYLPLQINRASRPFFLVSGRDNRLVAVEPKSVQPYLRQRPEPPVVYKDYSLNSLIALSIGGQKYRVRSPAARVVA